jgi:hypothetical protein
LFCFNIPIFAALLCAVALAQSRFCGGKARKKFLPQRHRDTEKEAEDIVFLTFFSVSPCLCVSVVKISYLGIRGARRKEALNGVLQQVGKSFFGSFFSKKEPLALAFSGSHEARR